MPLPNPVGLQREVLALPSTGHYVVLGTAGSGKTTLAILRSAFLSRTACDLGGRVLLVTFNKALVTYLKAISDDELDNVDVLNYHTFARGYLRYRGLINWGEIVNGKSKKVEIIKDALDHLIAEEGENHIYCKSPEVFCEEIDWLQKMGITELDEYKNIIRVGRSGTRIKRSDRKYFFRVYQKYVDLRREFGFRYDWDDIAYFVKNELAVDEDERYYNHIVIDEGQDLSPVMLQSLVGAIPEHGSVTFFGDVAQQIYGGRLSWRSAGLNPPRVWNFEENYRNTKEIATLGLAISNLSFFKDVPDMVQPRSFRASGPLPTLVDFQSEDDEMGTILTVAINGSKTQTVAVLVRDRETVRKIIYGLLAQGVSAQELHGKMNTWRQNHGISVGTYHSAKGLEFDMVILPFCNSETLPDQGRVTALEDIDEAMAEEVKLIYVGVTRAKQRLLITYTGEITPLLPQGGKLYQRVSR